MKAKIIVAKVTNCQIAHKGILSLWFYRIVRYRLTDAFTVISSDYGQCIAVRSNWRKTARQKLYIIINHVTTQARDVMKTVRVFMLKISVKNSVSAALIVSIENFTVHEF